MLESVTDYLKGKPRAKRSSHWSTTRKAHLSKHPVCEVCGAKKNLNVHHIFPVHICPEGELDSNNLITLCESKPNNCHLFIGHLKSWLSYNETAREDAAAWREKIKTRP